MQSNFYCAESFNESEQNMQLHFSDIYWYQLFLSSHRLFWILFEKLCRPAQRWWILQRAAMAVGVRRCGLLFKQYSVSLKQSDSPGSLNSSGSRFRVGLRVLPGPAKCQIWKKLYLYQHQSSNLMFLWRWKRRISLFSIEFTVDEAQYFFCWLCYGASCTHFCVFEDFWRTRNSTQWQILGLTRK